MENSRLTDKEHMDGRRNLSINAVCRLVQYDQLKTGLATLCREAETASELVEITGISEYHTQIKCITRVGSHLL